MLICYEDQPVTKPAKKSSSIVSHGSCSSKRCKKINFQSIAGWPSWNVFYWQFLVLFHYAFTVRCPPTISPALKTPPAYIMATDFFTRICLCCTDDTLDNEIEIMNNVLRTEQQYQVCGMQILLSVMQSITSTTGLIYPNHDVLTLWQSMLSSEYMQHQVNITPHMRAILVHWLMEVGHEYMLKRSTVNLAINYVDRVLTQVWELATACPKCLSFVFYPFHLFVILICFFDFFLFCFGHFVSFVIFWTFLSLLSLLSAYFCLFDLFRHAMWSCRDCSCLVLLAFTLQPS